MKHLFHIPFIILMLWSSAMSNAMYSDVHGCHNIENITNRTVIDVGLTAQLIDNIDPEDRTKIQLAALVASGPEIGVSIFEAVAATRLVRQSKYADRAYIGKSADEIRLALAKKDLQGFNEAWEFVRTHPRGADAWEMIRIAIDNNNGYTQFARDLKTLQKVAGYLSEIPPPNGIRKIDAIGGEEGLYNFISKNRDVPCASCGSGGHLVFAGRNMDEMIENFVEVGYQYRNHPEHWSKLISGMEHPLPAMREGTQHLLKTIKENQVKYAPNKIQSFDLKFEELIDDIDLCPACRYDIRFKDEFIGSTTPKFAEFKSYALSTWQNIVNKPKFLQQFERYLQDISEINELQYIFNSSKASETQVKEAFKDLFVAKANDMFKPVSQGGVGIDKMKQLFEFEIYQFENAAEFIGLINNNQVFRNNALKFIKAE